MPDLWNYSDTKSDPICEKNWIQIRPKSVRVGVDSILGWINPNPLTTTSQSFSGSLSLFWCSEFVLFWDLLDWSDSVPSEEERSGWFWYEWLNCIGGIGVFGRFWYWGFGNDLSGSRGYCIFPRLTWEDFYSCSGLTRYSLLRSSQAFRQNLKPRLDKFSLYCFQIGIDHSFFNHSSSAIAIFHTTFHEQFDRMIYFGFYM